MLLLALAAALPLSSLAAQIVAGRGDWRTYSTKNFDIHYQRADFVLSRRMGEIAERVHEKLEPKYKSGANRTQVVLATSLDTVNAFASPLGMDRVVLFLEHPRPADFSRYDLWLELLFTHEYTHILTIRFQDSPVLMAFRILVGVQPNFTVPQGLIEGYAVYEESQKGTGRLKDPLTRMTLRTAVADNVFPNAAEAVNGSHRWPHGAIPYLYGAQIAEYMFRTNPDGASRFYRTSELGLMFDSKLSGVNFHGFRTLYNRISQEKQEEMRGEIAEILSRGITPFSRLTSDGESKEHLTAGEEGLLFFARPAASPPGLYRWISGQKEPQFVRRVYSGEGVAEAGGRLIASEDHFPFPGALRQELHDGHRFFLPARLIPGQSAFDPVLSRSGKTIFYVEKDRGGRRLVRAPLDGMDVGKKSVLYRTPFTGILRMPALSPDETKIAFISRQGENGMGAVTVCTIGEAQDCREYAGGPAAKARPRFSPDGTEVYFSSDADGVYNFYSIDLASGEIFRRTRTVTGLFDPVPAKDGLYGLMYTSGGYDLVHIKSADLLREKENIFAPGGTSPQTESSFFDEENPATAESSDTLDGEQTPPGEVEDPAYSSFLSIRPFLSGLLSGGPYILGLGGAAFDPLDRHFLAAGIVPGSPDPYAYAYYDYARFVLGTSVYFSTNYWKRDRAPGCINPDHPLRFICADKYAFEEDAAASLRYTYAGRYVSFQVLPGYVSHKIRNARQLRSIEYDARDLNLAGPSLILLAGNADTYYESISPERGWRFYAQSEYYTPAESKRELDRIAQDVEFGTAEGGLALYLPSFMDHHVNYLSAYGFTSYGPDREVANVRLARLQRGIAYDRSPIGPSSMVFTYEYRLPLLWASQPLLDATEVMLRHVGMSLFVETGAAFNKLPYRRDYQTSIGVSFQTGLTFVYLPLAPFRLTFVKGLGKTGESQVWFGFSTGLATGSDSIPNARIVEPYRRALPKFRDQPGYFRNPDAGGILE
jgi:hypothetical protein